MKKILLFIIIFISINSFANPQTKTDSIKNILANSKVDTVQIISYLHLGDLYEFTIPDTALFYYQKALKQAEISKNQKFIAKSSTYIGFIYSDKSNNDAAKKCFLVSLKIYQELNDKVHIAYSYENIGRVYSDQNQFNKARAYYLNAIKIYEEIGDKENIASCLINIGNAYYYQGQYNKSLENYLKALDINEKLGNKNGMAKTLINIGVLYYDQENTEKALEYYLQALTINKELGDRNGVAANLSNIGILYSDQGNYDKSIDNFKKALKINKEIGNKNYIAANLVNIGVVYSEQDNFEKALEYYLKAEKVNREIGNKYGIALNLVNIANLYSDLAQYSKAKKHAFKALEIATEIGSLERKKAAYEALSEAFIGLNNYSKALEYKDKWIAVKDSIFNTEKTKAIAEMNTKYESEKKEKQIIQQQAELKTSKLEAEKEKAEKERQQTQRNMFIVAFGLMIILAGFVFRSYKQKKKANLLLVEQKKQIAKANGELNRKNGEITAQRDKIEAQRDVVLKQKEEIEEIHHEISQSINYATRLQGAILPEEKILDKYLSEHFVLFKPKDKVSGDFYWWSHIENHTVITAADSTGHGVPGAFMSMLGSSFLREIVQKEYVTHTGVILRKLRKEIIKALKQKGESGEQKDGMDMAIISIDHETNKVQFSGANNPLYIITTSPIENRTPLKDFENFYEIKADKMPIAIYDKMDNFKAHEIQLKKGDMMYMFSDGFADQFGGKNQAARDAGGKKFKYKPFRRLILEISNRPMREQKDLLNSAFESWKGDLEQIDDVVIIGVKI